MNHLMEFHTLAMTSLPLGVGDIFSWAASTATKIDTTFKLIAGVVVAIIAFFAAIKGGFTFAKALGAAVIAGFVIWLVVLGGITDIAGWWQSASKGG
jgi:hypothetical protein